MRLRLLPWLIAMALPGCLLVFPEEQPAPEQSPKLPRPVDLVCTGTLQNCDGALSNGCESDVSSDPWNCGECARACDPGAACNLSSCGRAPVTLASGQLQPTRIIAHQGDLYWIQGVALDPGSGAPDGAIQRLRHDLSYPDLFVSGQAGPESLAADDAYVYWANREGGELLRMKRFGLPRIPEVVASGLNGPRALVRHDHWLYWASAPDHAAYRCNVEACAPSLVATLPEAVVSVAATDQAVFVAGVTSLLRINASLDSAFTLAERRSRIVDLIASPPAVFWIEQGPVATRETGLVAASDTALRVIAGKQDGPAGIAVDDQFVYWTNLLGGTVMKAPRGGGSAVAIAANQAQPWGIAVDDRGVYWTDYGSGLVMHQPHAQGDTSSTD